jgi:hypothetical protein
MKYLYSEDTGFKFQSDIWLFFTYLSEYRDHISNYAKTYFFLIRSHSTFWLTAQSLGRFPDGTFSILTRLSFMTIFSYHLTP